MITVVHVITKLEMGGAQENTLHTVEHLDRARFRVALLHGPGGFYDTQAAQIRALDREVVPSLVREVRPKSDATCFAALRRAFEVRMEAHQRAGGDPRAFIVHTHSSKAGILGRLAARAARVPIVVHTIHGFGFFEGQHPAKQAVFVAAERAAARVTDAFISVSRANLAEGIARGIVRAGQETRVIRSGFDLAPFRAVRSKDASVDARRRLDLVEGDEVVVVIANLKPQKDPLTMVEAIRQLVLERPRAVCLYAGDGELRPEVERAIATAGLRERFRLLGWREDVPELLAAADVVALSSIFEGLPRTAVQAVAAARPFVGTRVDGTPEIIREGRNGFLVEPRNPTALARALGRALSERPVDPEDDRRVNDWDAAEMVRAQEELYEELVRAR